MKNIWDYDLDENNIEQCEETDCRFFSECPYENNLCMCAFDEEIEQKDEQEALSKWEKLTQKEDKEMEMMGWHDRAIGGKPQTVLCLSCAAKRGGLTDDDWQNVTGEGWACDDCGYQEKGGQNDR